MTDLPSTSRPRAMLIGCYSGGDEKPVCEEHLVELSRLADTFGIEAVESHPCPVRKINRSTYIGKGKLAELVERAQELKVEYVIFDEELAPSQQRNLEEAFGIMLLERTEVILGVFDLHARTKEARLQIELAQVRYMFPRLKRLWTHLSRQRGGGLAVKGKGEQQIELDRRQLSARMTRLESELKEVKRQRATQRHSRKRTGIPTFSIVGYTNAGKSTLLNALCDAGVLVEDQLFATLDTTTRKFTLPNNQEILLTDTVGFIRKIPHQLVAAFKSTLEEAKYGDVLLHVVDASHPLAYEQAEATIEVLKELEAFDKPTITVLNKSDAGNQGMAMRLRTIYPKTVQISAIEKTGFDQLLQLMEEELALLRQETHLRIPQSDYALVSEVMEKGEVLEKEYEGNDVVLKVRLPSDLMYKVEDYLEERCLE